jgi:zinc/manganese transport system ATP-binding protein
MATETSNPNIQNTEPPELEVVNLTKQFGSFVALDQVSLKLKSGSFHALLGENGAGKSTLLGALSGQLQAVEGSIHFGQAQSAAVAYLPQQSLIDREFPVRVLDVVLLGAWREFKSFSRVTDQMRTRATQALAAVGLVGFERRFIGELSVGQLQRVLFARVLMQDAAIILLDEPFNALDTRTAEDLLEVVLGWHRQARTVIAVLHDMSMVRTHFPQTLLLAREVIAWGQSVEALTPENISRARQTSEYWDERAPWCARPDGVGMVR